MYHTFHLCPKACRTAKGMEQIDLFHICSTSVTLFVGTTISSFKKIEMLDKQQALLQQRLTSLELEAHRREKFNKCE